MKLLYRFLAFAFIVLLAACSGSDTYRGEWKATASDGTHATLFFEAKKLRITDANGTTTEFAYSQHLVDVNNSAKTYGIELGDGRKFQLLFPASTDGNKGVMVDGNGVPVYTIGRKEYVRYEELSKP